MDFARPLAVPTPAKPASLGRGGARERAELFVPQNKNVASGLYADEAAAFLRASFHEEEALLVV